LKRKLKKYFGILFTSTFISSSVLNSFNVVYASNNWIKGWTGKSGSNDFKFEENGKSVTIESTKVNNGKFTDSEDSLIYYANEISGDTDFELSATVSIDEYNVMEDSSNPQQGSVGIAVLDELFNKTDEKSYTNGIFLGTWAKSKNDKLAFYPIVRNNSETKIINEAISESFSNTGTDLGVFNLSIKKEGNVYTFVCGDNSKTLEMNGFSGTLYPCFYIARNAKATFSNFKIDIETKKILELEVTEPAKKVYTYGQDIDLTGMTVTAKYDDGTEETVNDYIVKGFYPNKIGKQTISINKGNASYDFEVEVQKIKCTDIEVRYAPIKTEYYVGSNFKTEGMEVYAKYNNGEEEILNSDEYTLKIGNKIIENNHKIDDNIVGKQIVKVYRNNSEGISGTSTAGSFTIDVKKAYSYNIEIEKEPLKKVYYIGDSIDITGLKVKSVIKNQIGEDETEIIKSDEYTLSGLDTSTPGKKTITVTLKNDNTKSASFDIEVKQRSEIGLKLLKYPRTTYSIGENFDSKNMIVAVEYDNGDTEESDNCYTIDTSSFDSSKLGKTSITVLPANQNFKPIKIDITIVEEKEHKWRKAVFGQSSGSDKQDTGMVGVTAENYGTIDGTINIKAWDGNGKITGDHDGIAYYYTRVSGENNFSLTADVKVNKYLEHDNDDTKRNGQEAFGLMARDVVPLVGKDGERTINPEEAELDEEGVPITQEKSIVFASNMAIAGGYSGTGWPSDPDAANYEKNTKLNRINLYARTGVTAVDGGGNKVGPYAISENFPKEGDKFRINISKVNGGIYASCYDYQNGETKESFIPEDDLLTIQNKDYAYVGFFCARWADIDVSNVEFFETVKETDQIMEQKQNIQLTPSISITSPNYTEKQRYKLEIEAENASGLITVKQNDKIIVKDLEINQGLNYINTNVNRNSSNDFTVLFTPNDTLPLTSYDDIIERINVVHREFDKTMETVYVSNDGKFDGDGSIENPYDIDTAVGFLGEGQTIVMLEGTYKRSEPIVIPLGNNGSKEKYKKIVAQEGKKVTVDLQKASAGAVITGNYWHIKGIDFINSGDNLKAFQLGGSNCIIEECKFYDNGDIGLQISRTYPTDDFNLWPANNLILNCESYNNCDPSMINADGFGAKLTVGKGNIFRNCSSHNNVDDGWDLYTKVNTGAIGEVTLENCVSYRNGYKLLSDGTEIPYGSGGHNGFKLGGENVYVKHKLINCISYGNEANGITTNSNPALKLENVLSYDNEDANFRLYSDKPAEYDYDAKSCISYNGGETDMIGTINRDESYTNLSTNPIINDSNYFILDKTGQSKNNSGNVITKEAFEDALKTIQK